MSTKKPKHKRLFTLPRLLIILLVAALLTIAAWFALRAVLVKTVVSNITNYEAQGYQISHDGLTVNGFPFSINAHMPNISARAPTSQTLSPDKNWFLKLDQFLLTSSTLTPLSWSLKHTGAMRVDMRGRGGDRYMFDIAPAHITSDIIANLSGHLKSAKFYSGPANINPLVGNGLAVQSIGNIRGELSVGGETAHLSMTGHDIVFSNQAIRAFNGLLDRELSLAAFEADIGNWLVLEQNGLLVWQNSGGTITSKSWSIKWGDIDILGDFDIRIQGGAPEGIMHIQVKNTASLIDKFTKSGLISPAISAQAHMFLGALDTNAAGRHELEFTLQKGVVKYGFLTLYKF